jgi:two-component system LytT family sensor kinase
VTITAECRGADGIDEHYAIVIRDDGVGMDEDAVLAAVDGTGSTEAHALSNINERLRAAFGAEYGLGLTSSPEKGTSVTVRIPR